jgi:exopolysaccharide production protein ExoY
MSISASFVGLASAPAQTRRAARFGKRLLDIVGATIALLVLAPLMCTIAIAIFATDPGPVIFRQRRVGRGGRDFRIVKFRTMVVDAEQRLWGDPALFARYLEGDHKLDPKEDPRITRIGRLLRSSSLDELPQLFNVIAGSMSLVGPRPVLESEVRHYGERVARVLSVRPGMTGLWQVSGRSNVARDQRVVLDESYAGDWSITGDIGILARTVFVVATRIGAF